MGGRTHRPDPGPAATRRSPGEARHAARSDGCAEDPGAGDPAGGARQNPGRPRAGHDVRHRARCTADAGPAPTDQAGNPAEAHTGALARAAEEVPDAAGDARRDEAPLRARRTPGQPEHAAPRTELSAPRAECAGASRSPRARQLAQLVPAALAAQVAPLLVPGAEHDALCRTALGLDVM